MKIKQKISRCKETINQQCPECLHAMSNHTLTIDTKDRKYLKINCIKCKCRNGSFD